MILAHGVASVASVASVAGIAGFDWVDGIVIVLALLAAVRGLRLGGVIQLLSYGGFWVGLFIGAALAPVFVPLARGALAKALVSLLVVFGVAAILGGVGRTAGARLWSALRSSPLATADAALGVGVAVVATLAACWLAATILVRGPAQSLSAGIASSRIIQGLDHVLPPAPGVFDRIQHFVNTSGLPQVFNQITPPALGPVNLPTTPMLQAAASRAGPSMVKVVGEGCGQTQEGSGFVVARDLVVTNAHVVAGIANPMVVDRAGNQLPAQAVEFDPSFDLAVLHVAGLSEPALSLDTSEVSRGAQAAVLGYPEGGPIAIGPAGVLQVFQAQGSDIYGQGQSVRPVYAIQADVLPGNSGGPLVEPDGLVIGVVFSKSVSSPQLGYALASPGVATRVAQAQAHPTPGTGHCTA